MADPERKDFFISFTSVDKEKAKEIASVLNEAGFSTVFQPHDFSAGSSFVLDMHEAAKICDRTIAVVSPAYLSAEYCQPEWAAAFAKDPTGKKRKLVLIRIKECELDGILTPIVCIDLIGKSGEAAKTHLLQKLKQVMGKLETPQSKRAKPGSIWRVPHMRNTHFTGRDDILTSLESALTGGEIAAVNQTLAGMGGIGKTQIALEYCYRHRDDYPVIWWCRAEETAALTQDYAELAVKLCLGGASLDDLPATKNVLLEWLVSEGGWLLVLDNAENYKSIKDFLPRGGLGHLIITTRHRTWGSGFSTLVTDLWSEPEALDFLKKRLDKHQKNDAKELAEILGYLPLALEQAAAYIESTRCSIQDYLRYFNDNFAELSKKGLDLKEGYEFNVATTWLTSFECVEEENKAAAELLKLCAFFAPDDIPFFMIREGEEFLPEALQEAAGEDLKWNEAVAVLRKFSLIEIGEQTLSLHRLVQEVTRLRMKEKEKKKWAEAAVKVVNNATPSGAQDVRTWDVCQAILDHGLAVGAHGEKLEIVPKQTGRVLNNIAAYLWGRAEFMRAKENFERAISLYEKAYSPDHSHVATAINNLGSVLYGMGDMDGAKAHFERAFKTDEKAYGPDHPNVARDGNNLGAVLQGMGDLEGAKTYYERALEIDEKAFGPDHSEVATDASNLGGVLQDMGDLEGAKAHFERALKIDEKAYGPDHPEVATDANNLGSVLKAMGDLTGAKAHYERALQIDEKALGLDHPSVARDANNLGSVLYTLGNYQGALSLMDRVRAIREKMLPPDHPHLTQAYENTAACHRALGDEAKAKEYYAKAQAIYDSRKKSGKDGKVEEQE